MKYICLLIFVFCFSACNTSEDQIRLKLTEGKSSTSSNNETEVSSWGIWNFEAASDYTYDSNFVELASGNATLKTIDLSHSGTDFNSGSHVGSSALASKVTLSSSSEDILDSSWTPEYANLVAYWRMENNFQDSINSHNGSAVDMAFSSPRLGRSSGYFNGSTSRVIIPTSPNLKPTVASTVCSWIKPDKVNDRRGIFVPRDTSSGGANIFALNSGRLEFNSYHGSIWHTVFSSTIIVTNQWHFVCATYEKNSHIRLYINGIQDGSKTVGAEAMVHSSQDIQIGKAQHGAPYFEGLIDEVSFWDVSLDDSQIEDIYNKQNKKYSDQTELNSTWTPKYSSLVGYWKMDGNWQDSSGNGRHGTAVADSTITSSSKVGNGAGSFDGAGDYMEVSGFPHQSSFTVSSWVNPASWSGDGYRGVISRGAVFDNNTNFLIALRNRTIGVGDYRVNFYMRDFSGTAFSLGHILDKTPANVWSHIAISFDCASKVAKIYFNGFKVEEGVSSFCPTDGGLPLRIGSPATVDSTDDPYDGRVDEGAVWSSVLTDQDVSLIYNRQKQKYAGHYESPIINMGTPTVPTKMDWLTDLPFMKELPKTSESSADYSALVGSTGNTSDNDLMSGIVGLWHFSETSWNDIAGEVRDQSNNNNHGRAKNSLTTTPRSLMKGSGVFDGVNDYIQIPYDSSLSPSLVSVSVWFKSSNTNIQQILSKTEFGGFAVSTGMTWRDCLATEVCWSAEISGTYYMARAPMSLLRMGEWNHFAGSYDGTSLKIYINGNYISSTNISGTISYTNNTPLCVGAEGTMTGCSGDYFSGLIDELAIWDRALHADEVKQLYRRGANRLKVQTRTCADSTCSADEEWQGPDNANGEFYFSELNNCTVRNADGTCDLAAGLIQTINPEYTLSNFTNYVMAPKQYFQYRVLMESDDESGTPTFPSLTSINFGTKYFGGKPTVVTKTGHAFTSLSDFSVTISGTCTPKFQLGLGLTDWYYWNGSNWVAAVDTPADVLEANTETDISANISSFVADQGSGSLYIRAFLESDSDQACSLDQIQINGK